MESAPPLVLELTADEAAVLAAALRQYEPFWPGSLPDADRAALLARVRLSVEALTGRLLAG